MAKGTFFKDFREFISKGNIIDIWLPEGTGFGWQNARVYVISEG